MIFWGKEVDCDSRKILGLSVNKKDVGIPDPSHKQIVCTTHPMQLVED